MENINFVVSANSDELISAIENHFDSESLINKISDQVINELDMNDLADKVVDEIDDDALIEKLMNNVDLDDYLDYDDIAERVEHRMTDVTDTIHRLITDYNPGYHCHLGDDVTELIYKAIEHLLSTENFAKLMGGFINNWLYPAEIPSAEEIQANAFKYKDASNSIDTTVNPVQQMITLTSDELHHILKLAKFDCKLPEKIELFLKDTTK